MTEAEKALTTRGDAARLLIEAEPHLLRIECGLVLMTMIEAAPDGSSARLTGYIVDRMLEDVSHLRAALWPSVRP
jgi:hypothetical protein